MVVKDSVDPSHEACHQGLSDSYADFWAPTLELVQQVPREDHRHVVQEPALSQGRKLLPVEAKVFFCLILTLDIEVGNKMKEAKVHIRESTLDEDGCCTGWLKDVRCASEMGVSSSPRTSDIERELGMSST